MDNRDPRYEPPNVGCAVLVAPLFIACAMFFGVAEVILFTKDHKDVHHPIFTVILTFFVTFGSSLNWAQRIPRRNDSALGASFGIVGIALGAAALVYAFTFTLGSVLVAPGCSSH